MRISHAVWEGFYWQGLGALPFMVLTLIGGANVGDVCVGDLMGVVVMATIGGHTCGETIK